jgi:UDP-N-acetylglucosamine acyltransferase
MAYVGGWTKVAQDVPPYFIVEGNPAEARAVNVVGLRRNNVPPEIRLDLQRAFKIIYRSGLNRAHALDRIKSEIAMSGPIAHLVGFIESSKRGIC